uniref:DUF3854 domain-containing protein n=1 Tax=Caenorhabditis tropicalis TaxID=1561998 RepID=A0A1I7TWC2_9PELO
MGQVQRKLFGADPVAPDEPDAPEDRATPEVPAEERATPEVPAEDRATPEEPAEDRATPEVSSATSSRKRGATESPDAEAPVKRAHVEEYPNNEKGTQTDGKPQKDVNLYKREEMPTGSTREQLLSKVNLEKLKTRRQKLYSENFHDVCLPFNYSIDVKSWTQKRLLEMASQFMGSEEVEIFRFLKCDGKVADLPTDDLFLNVNENRAIFSWRKFKKFAFMMEQLKRSIRRNNIGLVITGRVADCPSPPPRYKYREIGFQIEPIETIIDKLITEDAHVSVGGKRFAEIDLAEGRLNRLGAGFGSVALPFDYSIDFEHWTHKQLVEVVAQFLPNAAAHGIDALWLVDGSMFEKFSTTTPEGKRLFRDLNRRTANISAAEMLQVKKNFDAIRKARDDLEKAQERPELE